MYSLPPSVGDACAIVPIVDCVDTSPTGFVAMFGYKNPDTVLKTIDVGPLNVFSPAPENRNQPSAFKPGEAHRVLHVPFDAGDLTWTLNGHSVTANMSGGSCTIIE